jgi:hypothetical protein
MSFALWDFTIVTGPTEGMSTISELIFIRR